MSQPAFKFSGKDTLEDTFGTLSRFKDLRGVRLKV
jgi:hypothetical protein